VGCAISIAPNRSRAVLQRTPLYEAALARLSREIAVGAAFDETEAVKEIESQLAKSPRRGAQDRTKAARGEADAQTRKPTVTNAAVADEAA